MDTKAIYYVNYNSHLYTFSFVFISRYQAILAAVVDGCRLTNCGIPEMIKSERFGSEAEHKMRYIL